MQGQSLWGICQGPPGHREPLTFFDFCGRVPIFSLMLNTYAQDTVMKILKTIFAVMTIAMLIVSCAADPEKRKKQSQEAYPNQEWRRPPAHWSPP
jgi:hypothetical protein